MVSSRKLGGGNIFINVWLVEGTHYSFLVLEEYFYQVSRIKFYMQKFRVALLKQPRFFNEYDKWDEREN